MTSTASLAQCPAGTSLKVVTWDAAVVVTAGVAGVVGVAVWALAAPMLRARVEAIIRDLRMRFSFSHRYGIPPLVHGLTVGRSGECPVKRNE